MFAALSENLAFFKERLNLAIMIAPTAHIHNCTSRVVKKTVSSSSCSKILEKLGPEILPKPVVTGRISAGFNRLPGVAYYGLKLTEGNPEAVSP